MIKYFDTPSGYFANLFGEAGCMDATIHRPCDNTGGKWRLCYATCTGQVKEMQGKVEDFRILANIKARLSEFDRTLNGGTA